MSIPKKTQHAEVAVSERFRLVRELTENICAGLALEDYGSQPVVDVSPPKWHLGHTTWFFETFVLTVYSDAYRVFDQQFSYLFNSYYNNVGKRVQRVNRGQLTRPLVKDVYAYRAHVNEAMDAFLQKAIALPNYEEILSVVEVGLQHEQQHQELLWTDLKFILGTQPLKPRYAESGLTIDDEPTVAFEDTWIEIPEGTHTIGYTSKGFSFDNEHGKHEVKLDAFEIRSSLVRNEEYLEFIHAGGYEDFNLWHDEGWAWVQQNNIQAPLYWERDGADWHEYSLTGYRPVDPKQTLKHISFFEASAFARWKGLRLPTEFEWETAADYFEWGSRWEWTNSAYLPYPGYKIAPGAIGEYNGKFMVSQHVLRGASVATSPDHSRKTYRNFFHPPLRWQYTGIRLAK
jgi:ergothioneine biosynthesis protein EgtB